MIEQTLINNMLHTNMCGMQYDEANYMYYSKRTFQGHREAEGHGFSKQVCDLPIAESSEEQRKMKKNSEEYREHLRRIGAKGGHASAQAKIKKYGTINPLKVRAKISNTVKQLWRDPKYRKKAIEGRSKLWREIWRQRKKDELFMKKRSERMSQIAKLNWRKQDYRTNISESISKTMKKKIRDDLTYKDTITKRVVEAVKTLEVREKISELKKKLYDEHPEKHPNVTSARNNRFSGFEREIDKLLHVFNVSHQHQFRVGRRYCDFAFPDCRVIIECDGRYWHKDKEKDVKRDREILKKLNGWQIFHLLEEKRETASSVIKQLLKLD